MDFPEKILLEWFPWDVQDLGGGRSRETSLGKGTVWCPTGKREKLSDSPDLAAVYPYSVLSEGSFPCSIFKKIITVTL